MSRLHLDLRLYDPAAQEWRSLPPGVRVEVYDKDEYSDDLLADVTTTGAAMAIDLASSGAFDRPDLYFRVHFGDRALDPSSWTLVPPGAPGSLPLPDGVWDSTLHGDAEVRMDQTEADLGTAEFPVELRLGSGVVAARLQVWDRTQRRHVPAPAGVPLIAETLDGARVGSGATVDGGLAWIPVWTEERGRVRLSVPESALPLRYDRRRGALVDAAGPDQLVIARWTSEDVGLSTLPPAVHPDEPEESRRLARERVFDLSGRPYRHGNAIRPLLDGEETYCVLVDAIRRCERSAYLVNWDYQPHVVINRLQDEAPVTIQEVFDAVGADDGKELRLLPWRYTTPFPNEEARQKKLDELLDERSERLPGFRGQRQRTANTLRSHHQKALVVDGDTAYVGGLDFAFGRWATEDHIPYTDWQGDDPLGSDGDFGWFPWHDVHSVVQGPSALEVEENFRLRWAALTGHHLAPSGERAWTGGVPAFVARTWAADEGGAQRLPPVGDEDGRPVDERTIERLYLEEIAGADSSIYIEQQYLSHKEIAEVLAQRVERARAEGDRDFRVVLVLPCRYYEPPIVNGQLAAGQKACLDRLAEADPEGVHVLALTLRTWSKGDGTFLPIYVHSKLLIVDEVFCTVGSANTNARSMQFDTELNLVFEGREASRAFLDRLLNEHSRGKLDPSDSFADRVDALRTLAYANEEVRERAEQGLDLQGVDPHTCRAFPHVTENTPIPLPGPDWLF